MRPHNLSNNRYSSLPRGTYGAFLLLATLYTTFLILNAHQTTSCTELATRKAASGTATKPSGFVRPHSLSNNRYISLPRGTYGAFLLLAIIDATFLDSSHSLNRSKYTSINNNTTTKLIRCSRPRGQLPANGGMFSPISAGITCTLGARIAPH